MSSVLERSSDVPQINYLNYQQRKEFLRKNNEKLPFSEKYKGTEKQNIALLKFLKESPDFRKKWDLELRNMKDSVTHQKSEISKPRTEFEANIHAKEWTLLHSVTTSAYTHSEDPRWWKWTAINGTVQYNDGTNPNKPISCATNWAKYPPGTKFFIDGKYYAAHDYGSFVTEYPNRIDLYVPTKQAVNTWWLKKKNVTVVEMGDFNKARSILSEPTRQKLPFVRQMLRQLPA